MPVKIEEHWGYPAWCPRCQKSHYAALPIEVKKTGLVGPCLAALIAHMKGVCHASFSTIRKFLRDAVGVRLSRGHLRNLVNKAADALDAAYRGLLEKLPTEPRLNVDETGHEEEGQRFWTWWFVKIILDLDLAEDVDDAGALATLHALADRGEAEILGVLISSRNEWRVVKKLIRPGSPTLAGSCGNGCGQISAGALGVHVRADPMRRHQRT